jgi:transposase InsO family protein
MSCILTFAAAPQGVTRRGDWLLAFVCRPPGRRAVMESFFSTVNSELADRFESCGETKMELVDYLELFYNQRRRHSTLGHISPAAFERRAMTQAA